MTKPTERIRAIIRDARRAIGSPDNAPAVANEILTRKWSDVLADEDVLRHLLARGLNSEIRAFLSRHYDDHDGANASQLRAAQLSMWPEAARTYVEQIDRERVWVPSRDEFVELVPDALQPAEMREAGDYLLQHGADCIRRGRLLVRLAEIGGGTAG
jgi:hypothetical protein